MYRELNITSVDVVVSEVVVSEVVVFPTVLSFSDTGDELLLGPSCIICD